MAFVEPTAADLKDTFPAFSAVNDDTIAYWLTRAGRVVDQGWPAGDGPHAYMLLTAHYLVLAGLGTGAEAEMVAAGASGFTRLKSGALEIERASGGGAYAGTSYGQQFQALLGVIRGGPRVTGTGSIPFCGSAILGW